MTDYSLVDYLHMPITWIVILLIVIIIQLLIRRPCINVHVGGGKTYRDIYRTGTVL